jgi:hypothetical protein
VCSVTITALPPLKMEISGGSDLHVSMLLVSKYTGNCVLTLMFVVIFYSHGRGSGDY